MLHINRAGDFKHIVIHTEECIFSHMFDIYQYV